MNIIFTKYEIVISLENIIMSNTEIKEMYRVSSVILDGLWKLRLIFFAKVLLVILFPIIFLVSTIIHFIKSIYYKKKFQFYDYLVLIGNNDNEVIKIQIPL